jgi:hypothetical protein
MAAALISPVDFAAAASVSTVFNIVEAQSSLAVRIEARGFSDTDEQDLTGTIDATFDFGESGNFAETAEVTVSSAHVEAVAPFNFRLGLPVPFPGASVVASGIVADVTTPAPPASMTMLPTGALRYQFDASQFEISADQGTIVVTGFFNDSANLAEEPVSGVSPPGTLGRVTLTPGAVSGFYRRVDALLVLPIDISDIAEFGDEADPEEVAIDLDATVQATASFYVALSGVPGDGNGDSRVDGADLPVWEAGFGMKTAATVRDGDFDGDQDVDGADFLVWQQYQGTAPPAITATAVPEPSTWCAVLAVLTAAALRRRSAWKG